MSNPINPTQPKDQRPVLRTEIPGPQSRALRSREDALVAPGLQSYAVRAGIVRPDPAQPPPDGALPSSEDRFD